MNEEGWKQALSQELQDAGYDIDWNKVMRTWAGGAKTLT